MATPALVWGPLPDKPPGPPQTPAIITGPPALISRTTTTLTINILIDQPVQAWLEYGTTASLGAETTHETEYLTSHTQVISGLTSGVTYNVRAHVVNESGIHTLSSVYLFATVSSGATLQALIDAASPGGTVDVTGQSFTAGATINKALTLVGGGTATVTIAGGSTQGIVVTANDVVVDGMVITGPGSVTTVYALASQGIRVNATSAARVSGLEVLGCTISQFRAMGIFLNYASGALIQGNTITDVAFSGIYLPSDLNGTINGNTIRRVGIGDPYGVGGHGDRYNAYGIVTTNLAGQTRSNGTIISNNIVSDVPNWHGLDTHGGLNHQWLGNHVSRCNRGLFLTSSDVATAAQQVVTGNTFDEPTRRPDVVNTYPYNMEGLTIASSSTNPTGSGNVFDGWPFGEAIGGVHSLTNTIIRNSF